ncbi:unnamed protein product [Symbiodinium sp. CCMP2592]|nr:unnamed protein product [Symbiodinium sp. CCMP2592]
MKQIKCSPSKAPAPDATFKSEHASSYHGVLPPFVLNSLVAVEAPAPFAACEQYASKRKARAEEGGEDDMVPRAQDGEDDGMSDETLSLPGKAPKKSKNNKKKKKVKSKKVRSSKKMRSDSQLVDVLVEHLPTGKDSSSDEGFDDKNHNTKRTMRLQSNPKVKTATSDEAPVQSKPVKRARSNEAPVESKPMKRARSDEVPVQSHKKARSSEAPIQNETQAPKIKKKPNVFGKYKAGLYACKRYVFIKRFQEMFPKASFQTGNRYWLKCPERMELLADMPLTELKRRRFAPKGCLVHPYR